LMADCAAYLRPPEALALYEWFSRVVLPALSPVLSPSIWIVAENVRPSGPRPSSVSVPQGELPNEPGPAFRTVLEQAFGGHLASVDHAFRDMASSAPAAELVALVRERLLPVLPAELFGWYPAKAAE